MYIIVIIVYSVSGLKLPEYAHRRCSLEGKVCPAQLYKQMLDKTAVFTVGADSSNAMVRRQLMCEKWSHQVSFFFITTGVQCHKDCQPMELWSALFQETDRRYFDSNGSLLLYNKFLVLLQVAPCTTWACVCLRSTIWWWYCSLIVLKWWDFLVGYYHILCVFVRVFVHHSTGRAVVPGRQPLS